MNFNYNEKFNGKVYYSGPFWDSREISVAINALENGKWITAGENVYKFERAFSEKFNVKYSHMVNSGSSANLILIAGVKKYFKWNDDDEVIVSPVGFPTTIAPIYQNRLRPVFADVEWNTLNFDLNEVERKINERTRAILISPVLGNPPHIDMLAQIAHERNIILLLDNCDSLGSKWRGLYLNEYSAAWTTSFYPAHHITTGEGGMVCTDDSKLHDIFRSLSWWGRDCYCVGSANLLPGGTCKRRFSKWLDNYEGEIDHKYIFTNMGYNLKPLDLQGAIGIEQLKKFDLIDRLRKLHHDIIVNYFWDYKTVKRFSEADVCWFGVPFISDDKHKIVRYLEKNGIQTRNYFAGNILLHPGYKFLDDYRNYPEANRVLDKVFFIGCSPQYTEKHLNHIGKTIENYA